MSRHLIERFLESNSDLVMDNIHTAKTVSIDDANRRRPDKIYGLDGQMKWAMIVGGIDSPYMLDKGRVAAVPEQTSLESELAELKEFEI